MTYNHKVAISGVVGLFKWGNAILMTTSQRILRACMNTRKAKHVVFSYFLHKFTGACKSNHVL